MAGVEIVIVNYRTGALVVDCLRSLVPEVAAHPGTRVTVVDNASGDGSGALVGAAIAAEGWSWARLDESPVNGGFAAGNNRAVRAALAGRSPPGLFWLLNPDTRVHPGALAAISGFFAARPQVGIAGTLLEEANGEPWPYAFRFPSILGEVERGVRLGLVTRLLDKHAVLQRMGESPAPVDWVSGASMIVRREVFETAGLMDEDYFLYYEETDFCRAARRTGWECWYLPGARVLHIAGQSTGVSGADSARRRMPRYWFESRRRYFVKNHGRGYARVADLAWLGSHLVWSARRVLQSRPDPDPPRLWRDFAAASFGGRAGG